MKVAIQGQRASFHDIAARRFFDDSIEIVPCDAFADCFAAVKQGKADYAIVGLENSLYGSINPVYDLLLRSRFWIRGEVYLRVEQCLIGLPGAKIKNIKEVHSQIMALAQSEDYLDAHLPHAKRIEQHDTTASVEMVKKWNDPTKAAIASREAAKLHDVEILASEIETHKQNYTRFAIVESTKTPIDGANKTSLVLKTPADTKPGALYRALGTFAGRNINLLLLHSRPVIGTAWHYLFYIDVVGDADSDPLCPALAELAEQGCEVTILGSYQNGQP